MTERFSATCFASQPFRGYMMPWPALLGFSEHTICGCHTLSPAYSNDMYDLQRLPCVSQDSGTAYGMLVCSCLLAWQDGVSLHCCCCLCRFYYRVGDGTTWSTTYSFTTFVDVSQGEPR